MSDVPRRIATFVAGGPAAGINGVIKGIVQAADNLDIRVDGYLDGAHGLYHRKVVSLTRRMVENIPLLGGSILGTSRFFLESDDHIERVVANLREECVDGVISIGGEGTLQLSDRLRRHGVRAVHVPKTIDNDIAGVHQTFGFDTAVHEASRALSAIKLDAETCGLWFVVEIMGRYTGHLALEAGIASGCTRVLIPEAGPIQVAELQDLICSRAAVGLDWGVILVAESAHLGEGFITEHGRLGGIARVLAEHLSAPCTAVPEPPKLRHASLGYVLRCAQPTGYDRAYAAKLGLAAVQLMVESGSDGAVVGIQGESLKAIPMAEVAGVLKRVDLDGIHYRAMRAGEEYETARREILAHDKAHAISAERLRWLSQHADTRTMEQIAMRLGVEIETLIEVVGDLARENSATTVP